MTTLPTVYQFHGANVRVINRGDGRWFVAKDVCDVLQHTNSRVAIGRLDDDEKSVSNVYTSHCGITQTRKVSVINESGLYSLILTSRVPSAKAFKKWVTSEVLPSIRKHGGYVAGQEKVATGEMTRDQLMARALQMANDVLAEMEQRAVAAEAEAAQLGQRVDEPEPVAAVAQDHCNRGRCRNRSTGSAGRRME